MQITESLASFPAAAKAAQSAVATTSAAATQSEVQTKSPGAPPRPTAPALDVERGWSAELLASVDEFSSRRVAARAVTGVGLSALYGLALGARDGGVALLTDALSVPLALVAVCGLGIPALFIAFAFLDAPIEPKHMATATSRALATTGLVLAGLAPAAALFVVTTEGRPAAVLIACVGLFFSALVGFRAILVDILRRVTRAPAMTQLAAFGACLLFGGFAILLSVRVLTSFSSLFSPFAVFAGAS
jgi:hypothetical protein